MPHKYLRRLLIACSIVLLLLTFAVISLAWMPIHIETASEPEFRPVRRTSAGSRQGAKLTANDFRYVASKPLRSPLKDIEPETSIPAKEEAAEPKPLIPFTGTLVGILLDSEPGQSRAWIKVSGETILVSEGMELNVPGGPVVKTIKERRLILEIQEREVTIEVSDANLGESDE